MSTKMNYFEQQPGLGESGWMLAVSGIILPRALFRKVAMFNQVARGWG